MKVRIFVAVLLSLGFAVAAHAVTDEEHIPWDGAHRLLGTNGIINPEILVGFNPQPDPPADSAGAPLVLIDPNTASLTLTGQTGPQTFLLFFAIDLGDANLVVRDPTFGTSNFNSLTIGVDSEIAENTFLHLFDVVLGFTTSSSGLVDVTTVKGFNPQPDPPGTFGATSDLGLSFQYTSLSDATVSFQLLDAQGSALTLNAVPEPASLALFALGIGVLAALQHRRRPA